MKAECRYCEKPIPAYCREDAEFCNTEHRRLYWKRARERGEQVIERRRRSADLIDLDAMDPKDRLAELIKAARRVL